MSHMQEFVTTIDKKELDSWIGQSQPEEQFLKATEVRRNQHSMLTEYEKEKLRELDWISKIHQEDERQFLKIAHKEEENAKSNLQHVEGVKQKQEKWLNCLLGAFEEEKGIADLGARMP